MKRVLKVLPFLLGMSVSAAAYEGEDGGKRGGYTATGFTVGMEAGTSTFKNIISRKKPGSTAAVTAKTDDSSDNEDDKYSAETTKTGFSGDIFVGCNKQIGALVIGVLADFNLQYKARPSTRLTHREDKTQEETKLQRKYACEFKLRAGLNLGGPVLFVNCGTIVGKYLLERIKFDSAGKKVETSSSGDSSDDSSSKGTEKRTGIKPSWLLGVDVEVPLSQCFYVKVGGQKVFAKKIVDIEKSEFQSSEWVFKAGFGCRL
ncbi:MAG: hypothetical protein LBG13_03660 [Holosporales bacterium]|jgi:opacity protein-like surface antigen|nr:hypothetical protein [Holosporales bacterium]